MTKAKDELTTQSDNTLDELDWVDFHAFVKIQRNPPGLDGDMAAIRIRLEDDVRHKLLKWRDDAVAAQNLALLTRLEAEIYGSLPHIKDGKFIGEVKVIAVTAIQSERALIEKRMM